MLPIIVLHFYRLCNILINNLRSYDKIFVRRRCKFRHKPDHTFGQNVEDEYLYMKILGDSDEDNVNKIKRVLKSLPDWVEPHMVYPDTSVKAYDVLGQGQFGQVQKGKFRHGSTE